MMRISKSSLIMCDFLKSVSFFVLTAFLFFNSIMGIIVLFPYGIYMIYKVARRAGERKRAVILAEFKDALACMLSCMEAGGTIEGALREAAKSLEIMHGNGGLSKELEIVNHKLELSENLEDTLRELSERLGIREITSFVEIFSISKRCGGNLIELIRSSLRDLQIKLETTREIEGIIASARTETSVMRLMPLGIIIYLRVFSGGFLEPLYESMIGKLAMLIMCIIYLLLNEYCENLVLRAKRN